MFYKQRVLGNFWGRKDSAICASRTKRQRNLCQSQEQRWMLLRWAYEMNDKQFVYADRAVLSTSKVC